MGTWLERFFLTLCAGVLGATVLTNPLNLDRLQQATLIVAIIAMSIFAARTIERLRNGPMSAMNSNSAPSQAVLAPSSGSNVSDLATPNVVPSTGAGKREQEQASAPQAAPPSPTKKTVDRRSERPVALPEIVVDDFVIGDATLKGRMRLRNFGSVGATVQIRVQSNLNGNPMLLTGERPESVLFPAGSTKTLDFGPLSPDDAAAITSGEKTWEVIVGVGYGANYVEHGYRYRGGFAVQRQQFNLLEEKRW